MRDAVTEKCTSKEDYRIIHTKYFLAEDRLDRRREQADQFLYVSQFFEIENVILDLRHATRFHDIPGQSPEFRDNFVSRQWRLDSARHRFQTLFQRSVVEFYAHPRRAAPGTALLVKIRVVMRLDPGDQRPDIVLRDAL